MITCYQAHVYVERKIIYTSSKCYDRATDRSQWGAARRIFFVFRPISSIRQFLCPMCRINASALLRFAVYSKGNRPEKLCFIVKTIVLYFDRVLYPLLYLWTTMQARSIDWSHTLDDSWWKKPRYALKYAHF